MRLVTYTFPTETQAEICATNTSGASGAVLVINGGLSNYPAINSPGYIPYAKAGNGIQRSVTVFCSGNISTSTFTISGYDLQGYSYSTTVAGPSGTGLNVHTNTEFAVVTGVSVGNTAATTPFTVGFGASGTAGYFVVDNFANPVNLTYVIVQAASSGPATWQHTFDNVFTATAPTWANVTFGSGVSYASQTSATSITISETPFAIRCLLSATAAATGVIQVTAIQAGA